MTGICKLGTFMFSSKKGKRVYSGLNVLTFGSKIFFRLKVCKSTEFLSKV